VPDIRVDIAPDADPDGSPSLWQWLDVSAYRRQSADIELNVGRDDEAATVEAADSTVVFDLRDGLLAPRNPNSALYGRIGVNTPIRYRLRLAYDNFGRTSTGWGNADSGQEWSTGASYNAVNGGSGKVAIVSPNIASTGNLLGVGSLDIEVLYSTALSAVPTGGPWLSGVELRKVDDDNLYRVFTELKPAGVITMKIVRVLAGVALDLAEDLTVTGTFTAGAKVWTRAQAVGGSIRCKAWVGTLANEPTVWNLITNAVTIEGGSFAFYQWRHSTNTNVGTLTASIDDFTLDAMIWNGLVPEWSPKWDKSGNDATVTIQPAGPLRRLNQGEDPIESPLRRQLESYAPGGYWPLEDSTGSTAAGSGISGGRAAQAVDVTFGDDDSPPGAASSAKFNSTASLLRGYTTGDTGAAWAAMLFYKLPALPAADTLLVEWQCGAGTLRRWLLYITPAGYVLKVYDSDGNLDLSTITTTYGTGAAPTQWIAIQLEIVQNGTGVDWELVWHAINSETFYATSGTIASNTTGRLSGFRISGATALTDARFCHIWQGAGTLPFVTSSFHKVANGWAGETTSDRIIRLMVEQGLIVNVPGATTETLGPQTPQKFEDLIRECEAADGGLLIERGPSYLYLPRRWRYNPGVQLALDWSGGDLAEAPAPTDDDQRLFTRWKVKRTYGSEAVYVNAEAVARHGQMTNSKEININDDGRVAWHAAWATALTTVDDMRWPVIELDLIAHPELVPYFLTCRVGSRITVANPKSQVPGITIDLIIEGIKQKIGRNRWRVTLSCSPAKVWAQVAQWDTPGKLWGSKTTTLAEDIDLTETAWNISTSSRWEKWSTTATGYQWEIDGEVVTVTGMTAATGTGPYLQTATVVRGANGVTKTHSTGTAVRMAAPARYGL
jgi:hypothetical protein